MKKIIYAIVGLLFASGCNDSTIDDLTGKYQSPTEYTLTTLANMSIAKIDKPLRQVSLELTGGGNTLVVDFITNDYYLKAGNYAMGGEKPANGTWVPGATMFNSKPVLAGTINVGLTGGDQYTVGGILQISATETVDIDWVGTIVFPEDPPVVTYTLENSGPYVYTPDGQNYMALEGSQLNKITVYADDVLRAYFEIVTAAGAGSLAGTYPVSGSITDTSGAIVAGSYVDLPALGWGTDIIKSGSYLMDGETQQFLFGGSLTIAVAGDGLSFTSSDFTILDITTPFYAPAALPGTVSIGYLNGTEMAGTPAPMTYSVETATPYSYTQDGYTYIDIEGTTVHKVNVKQGAETLAYFELVSAADASLAGAYTLTDPVSAAGQAVVGSYMDLSWFGWGTDIIESGSYYVSNGAKMFIRAGDGVTLTVADNAGVLSIGGSGLPIQDISQPMWALLPDTGSVNFTNLQPAQ